jgi:hypothetical protein
MSDKPNADYAATVSKGVFPDEARPPTHCSRPSRWHRPWPAEAQSPSQCHGLRR